MEKLGDKPCRHYQESRINHAVCLCGYTYEEHMKEWNGSIEVVRRTTEKYKGVPVVLKSKIGRNAPCTCGSGKKAKKCCGK